MSGRHRLGSWSFPSGNSIDVDLVGKGRIRTLEFEWSSPPPLRAADELYYRVMVRPAVIRRAQEFLELPGAAVVCEL